MHEKEYNLVWGWLLDKNGECTAVNQYDEYGYKHVCNIWMNGSCLQNIERWDVMNHLG